MIIRICQFILEHLGLYGPITWPARQGLSGEYGSPGMALTQFFSRVQFTNPL